MHKVRVIEIPRSDKETSVKVGNEVHVLPPGIDGFFVRIPETKLSQKRKMEVKA